MGGRRQITIVGDQILWREVSVTIFSNYEDFYLSNVCRMLLFTKSKCRFEKQMLQPVTRTSTGKLPAGRGNNDTATPTRPNAKGPVTSTPNSKQVVVGSKANAEEIKEKMEQELRQQRAEHHKKRTLEMMQQKKGKQRLLHSQIKH